MTVPPGTFRLYPYAEPPLSAGKYVLTGAVSGMPGDVEDLPVRIDVVAPRFSLPPDQVLMTFPPASARGAFTSRLPQIVLRRRTLPWERSPDLSASTAPTPWLALVLIAEGEAELQHDRPVNQCVTSGVDLSDPSDVDVPKGTCLLVPQTVVDKAFPTREDLTSLTHIRQVDLNDTELAMGDDDGWMAVVLCNRLPQSNTKYLACLINLEGQWDVLPDPADIQEEPDYDPLLSILDLRVLAADLMTANAQKDTVVMGLPGDLSDGDDLGVEPMVPLTESAIATLASTGAGWATGPITGATKAYADAGAVTAGAGSTTPNQIAVSKLALADGFSFPALLALEPTYTFPVLAYWSFYCEEQGDFQYLAEHVSSRLLGHLNPHPEVPETPDGDPAPPGSAPPAPVGEAASGRPLPLTTQTGHVEMEAVTRRGDPTKAWFRGPLVPTPVDRAPLRTDGRPPLAHHADQLRRVTPDGHEDLGYAAAFEIGRLLALSQPGVTAALSRWRQEAYGAARVSGLTEQAYADLPYDVRQYVDEADLYAAEDTAEFPIHHAAGRRTVRGLLRLLGDQEESIAPARPAADPAAGDDVEVLLRGDRDSVVARGLGISALADVGTDDELAVVSLLAATPAVVAGERDHAADAALMRTALETESARLAGRELQ